MMTESNYAYIHNEFIEPFPHTNQNIQYFQNVLIKSKLQKTIYLSPKRHIASPVNS